MSLASRPLGWACAAALTATLAVTGCAPADEETAESPSSDDTASSSEPASGATDATPSSSKDSCAPEQLNLITPSTLTIATDRPAYEPWFVGNDPTNGKGFESAVAYAVAKELGFGRSDVEWVEEPFNKSFAPGAKDFDFDINQISILPEREEVVDFSDGYYQVAQAVIVLGDSDFATAGSLADLKDAAIGAQIGTTSLLAAKNGIQPSSPVAVFDDTNGAKQALLNGSIDAIIADLPTAFYITAVEIEGSKILGQFDATGPEPEEFGLLFEEGNPLVGCVNEAIGALEADGTLEAIEKKWLSQDVEVPELS
ncbi:MAG TPA: ABC transporter substrate-binding protein [Nocardioidaceae bacterium]|nr:ABC transporter substrate-binding protein [Nocardioidaceae bacterium]